MKKIRLILLLSIPVFLGCPKTDKRNMATSLLKIFGNDCVVYKSFTQKALNQTDALKAALESHQKNDKCDKIAGLLPELNRSTESLNRLKKNPLLLQEAEAEEKIQLLVLELNNPITAENVLLQQALTKELFAAKVSKIDAHAKAKAQQQSESQKALAEGLIDVSSYLQVLNRIHSDLSDCLQDNPSLNLQLAMTTVAIAGRFFNPTIGSALNMASNVIGTLVNFLSNKEVIDAIHALEDVSMDKALLCALESMTDTYCEAQDVASIFSVTQKELKTESVPENLEARFIQGVELVDYQLPDLIEWVQSVANASPSSDFISNTRLTEAKLDETTMNNLVSSLTAIINQNGSSVTQSKGTAKELAIRTAIDQVVNLLFTGSPAPSSPFSSPSTPVGRQFSRAKLLFKIALDTDVPSVLLAPPGSDTIGLSPGIDLNTIKNRALQIIEPVFQTVKRRGADLSNPDPSLKLSSGKESAKEGHLSALKVAQHFIEYFRFLEKKLKQKELQEFHLEIGEIKETKDILKNVAIILNTWEPDHYINRTEKRNRAIEKLEDLRYELHLSDSETYISDRIIYVMQRILIELGKSVLNPDIHLILKTSGQDILDKFSEGVSERDRNALNLRDILQAARNTSAHNLEIFIKTFSNNIAKALERAQAGAKKNNEVLDFEDKSRNFVHDVSNSIYSAQVCAIVLTSLGHWPEDIPLALCNGTIYPSSSSKLKDLTFDILFKEIVGKPLGVEQRMCRFRDFKRLDSLRKYY